jgi:hypothetical protein
MAERELEMLRTVPSEVSPRVRDLLSNARDAQLRAYRLAMAASGLLVPEE